MAVLSGCDRAEPEAETFAEHWQLVVADLVRFRALTTEPSPDARELAALRDRIRRHVVAMRAKAKRTEEKDFLAIASSRLDEILNQLDQVVQAAGEGSRDQVDEAAMKIGFMLEEMYKFLKLTDL